MKTAKNIIFFGLIIGCLFLLYEVFNQNSAAHMYWVWYERNEKELDSCKRLSIEKDKKIDSFIRVIDQMKE